MQDDIYFDPGNGQWVVLNGQIVERDALMIAEKIRDYDDSLVLVCLDNEGLESVHDAPFLVLKEMPDGSYDRILEAWELDDRIIERIWAADSAKNDPLVKLAEMELAKKRENEAAQAEHSALNVDLITSVMSNPKSTFTWQDPITGDKKMIHDERGVVSPTEPKVIAL